MFPISNWTELDVWRYIQREGIELPSIYYAHEREVFRRDGMWLAEGPWGGPRGAETLEREVGALPHRRRRLVHRRRRVHRRPPSTRSSPRSQRPGSPSAAPPGPTTGCPRPRWRTGSARATSDDTRSAALRDRRQRRRRQVHARRPAALRHQVGAGRPDRGRAARLGRQGPVRRRTCRCWSTGCAPSASRASRSTSRTATSPPRSASSCSPTPRATCSTPATRSPARPPRSWPCCSSTPATASSSRPAGTPPCSRCCGVPAARAGDQQDRPRRLRRGRAHRDRARTSPGWPARSGFADDAVVTIPVSALRRRQRRGALRAHPLVRGPDAARAPGVGARSPAPRWPRRSGCRCST